MIIYVPGPNRVAGMEVQQVPLLPLTRMPLLNLVNLMPAETKIDPDPTLRSLTNQDLSPVALIVLEV